MSQEGIKALGPGSTHIEICRRAFLVALVVGTILNLIKQGDIIFKGGCVDTAKLTLTYLVPFIVSVFGASSGRMVAHLKSQDTSKELA